MQGPYGTLFLIVVIEVRPRWIYASFLVTDAF
jgi:hypothetical protein